jgi:hypothetical protein
MIENMVSITTAESVVEGLSAGPAAAHGHAELKNVIGNTPFHARIQTFLNVMCTGIAST